MKILDKIAQRFGFVRPKMAVMRRGYSGADMSRLTSDWLASSTNGDVELRGACKVLRDRCRDRERNDDYARRFLALEANNVIGAKGITLQIKAVGRGGQTDNAASEAVETAWETWGRKENCTVTRRITWNQATRLALRSTSRDGGFLIRDVPNFGNRFGYAIQPLEIDHLGVDLNVPRSNERNEIKLGVELDSWGAPAAYWIYPRHPGEFQGTPLTTALVRIPANQMLHIFNPDRVSQTIGAPGMSSALLCMAIAGGYVEAELVAAREGACKGYGIKQPASDSYVGSGGSDSAGRQLEPVEPGMGLLLQPGEEFFQIDPKHPNDAFDPFMKSILRKMAAGLGVSYNSLANDLENVNYSSIRAGLLEEREEWKAKQEWLITEFCLPVFEKWLAWSLMNGAIPGYSMADYERLNQPKWTPRRWPWVDPQKDAEATRIAIACRLQSREEALAEQGKDIDEVDAEFEQDPITKDLDTDIAYVPQAAKAQELSGDNGNGDGGNDGPPNTPPRALGVARLLAGLRD